VFSLHNPNNISPFKVDVVVEPKRVFCLPPDMVLIQVAPKNQQVRLYFLSKESEEYLDFCVVVLLDKLSKNGFPNQMKENSKLKWVLGVGECS
jgi:hypothetical protein